MSNGLNSLNKWLQDTIFKPLEDKKMPVMEHLVELQVRLTRAVIITAVVFVGTFFYADMLVKWLRIPLQNMFRPGSLSWLPTDLPTVPFVFVAPFVLLTAVAFYAGIGFSFFFVLPFALNFLVSYGVNAGFIPQISIAQYVGFALWFLMVFGLIFEVPLAITLMAKLGWVDAPFLKRYRKWAFLGSFIFAAILTPTPDPFNQGLMALPMYAFYEVGILSAGFFNKKKPVPEGLARPAVATAAAGNGTAPSVGLPNVGEGDYVGVPTDRRR